MKKETLIASILGIFLGIVVAGGILLQFSFNKKEEKNVIENKENNITPTVISKKQEEYVFMVEEPEDDIVVHTETIDIMGKATKGSLIIIQSPTDQRVMKIQEEHFETSFPLSIGENVIVISFYPKDSTAVFEEKELHIYYFPL